MPGARSQLVRRVAAAIGTLRRSRGLTQEGLAAALDIAVKNVQRIESGKQNLSLETIERICVALDVQPEQLFTLEEAPASTGTPSIGERLAEAGFSVRSALERGRRASDAVPIMTVRAAAGRLDGSGRSVFNGGVREIQSRRDRPTARDPQNDDAAAGSRSTPPHRVG